LPPRHTALIEQLDAIQASGGGGTLNLDARKKLDVSRLEKVFFPKDGITKGDLMRYYVAVSEAIVPVMKDRPLVLKRFPNGITGKSFFQQNAPEDAPPGVRVETLRIPGRAVQDRLVGSDLLTLLYTVQLGSISVDPWHSRVQSLLYADYTILDLDPGPKARFSRVVAIARQVKSVLDDLKLYGALKTSGSSGLHVYIPLAPRTPLDAALVAAEIVARKVVDRDPKFATIERSVGARKATAVYVDYLQNILGKTVAGAYAVRARPGATVSAPLRWDELDDDLDPRDFTIKTIPKRLSTVRDIWGADLKRRASLSTIVGNQSHPARRSKR
jgi:bifunctional non-homologous end joining protein LigD